MPGGRREITQNLKIVFQVLVINEKQLQLKSTPFKEKSDAITNFAATITTRPTAIKKTLDSLTDGEEETQSGRDLVNVQTGRLGSAHVLNTCGERKNVYTRRTLKM